MEEDEYKDTEIGKIPKDWEIRHFGDVVKYNLGRTPSRSIKKYWENPYFYWVSISDMIQYGEIKFTKEKISKIALDEVFKSKYSLKGTLLMSFKLVIGRVSILSVDAVHNEAIISIFPFNNILDKFYLMYYLSNISYDRYLDRAVKGNTLNRKKLDMLHIIIPPLEEQKRIAYVLSKIQNAIKIQDRIINSLQELKKSMMHKLFTEGIGHTEFKDTEIGRIPKEWEIKTIEEISYKVKAGGTPRRKELKYWNGAIPFVTISDITNSRIYIYKTKEKISELGLNNSSAWLVPPNSLLVSMYATIGETAINKIEVATNQAILAIIPKPCFNVEFGAYVIKYYKKFLYNKNIQSTQKNVNKAILKNFKIPFPPLEEQKRIADILSTIDNKISIEENRKKYFEALFKTMLNKLMTGQIRVKNLEMRE